MDKQAEKWMAELHRWLTILIGYLKSRGEQAELKLVFVCSEESFNC